ncbi:hypothetical protein K456DRAFT_1403765 [Colletotrichum gloeosporioides 23]|nr:hypothetical protein K456DRAFT_1403765 [Colletotrichum gloeosporioides 23]
MSGFFRAAVRASVVLQKETGKRGSWWRRFLRMLLCKVSGSRWCGVCVWVGMLAVPARCVRAMLFCGDPILFPCCLVACLGFFRPASISDGNKTTTGTTYDRAPGNSFWNTYPRGQHFLLSTASLSCHTHAE